MYWCKTEQNQKPRDDKMEVSFVVLIVAHSSFSISFSFLFFFPNSKGKMPQSHSFSPSFDSLGMRRIYMYIPFQSGVFKHVVCTSHLLKKKTKKTNNLKICWKAYVPIHWSAHFEFLVMYLLNLWANCWEEWDCLCFLQSNSPPRGERYV